VNESPNAQQDATILAGTDLENPILIDLPRGTAAVLTRPHPLREPNQDALAVIPAGPDDVVLVVADGMGGTRGGAEAAATVVRHLRNGLPVGSTEQLLRTAILNGIESANAHLLAEVPDAGTTLAAVELSGHTARPYHVGDSVILIVGQRGALKLQTIAHSPVGFAVEAGLLDPEEALHHHERHYILNSVGSAEMRIELGAPVALARRDTVLLASDGLTDNVGLEEIIETIRKGPLERAVRNLATLARERMTSSRSGSPSKPDDLTILLYRRKE
jgi:serine/threonine protein phosphatase PrpC